MELSEAKTMRLWKRLKRTGECWKWEGQRQNRTGRGFVLSRKREYQVYRLVWGAFHGVYPRTGQLRPTCETKDCANPGHHDYKDRKYTMEEVIVSFPLATFDLVRDDYSMNRGTMEELAFKYCLKLGTVQVILS